MTERLAPMLFHGLSYTGAVPIRWERPISERDRRVIALWVAGVDREAIAQECGISHGRVSQIVFRYYLPRFHRVDAPRRRAQVISDADFWDWVDQSGGPDACWEWQGHRTPQGYGRHRRAYSLAVGPIPVGKMVLHSCDNPSCCNPTHLRVGDAGDNIRDAMARGRWKPCRPG
jgi:hypothetical protein